MVVRGSKMVKKILFVVLFFALIFALILFSGCLKIKTPANCSDIKHESLFDKARLGEVAMCYHEVAVGQALLKKDKDAALGACENISTGNIVSKAERDNCYIDIAELLKDPTICEEIEPNILEQEPLKKIMQSRRDLCKQKATKKSDAKICGGTVSVLFIIPLLFLFFYRKRKLKKEK